MRSSREHVTVSRRQDLKLNFEENQLLRERQRKRRLQTSLREESKGIGGNRERKLSKDPREKLLKNEEVIYNTKCQQEIHKINPEGYPQFFYKGISDLS